MMDYLTQAAIERGRQQTRRGFVAATDKIAALT